MFSLIQKLQRRPELVRKQAAFFVSGIIVLVIIVLWVRTFNNVEITEEVKDAEAPSTSDSLTPLYLLKEQFGDIRELFSEPPR